MKKLLIIGLCFHCFFGQLFAQKFPTPYEVSGKKGTATYAQCTNWYRNLQKAFPEITYFDSIGTGDLGKPIFIFRIYQSIPVASIKVLINNNIHPGEPEGTDATMLLAREILTDNAKWGSVLKNLDLYIICQYNVDGTLNRNCCSRANQNGPEELGFRANARNLDLNRDFIKCDSKSSKAFSKFFSKNDFDIFIDNHTSNGADYQHTLTYFHTRAEKLTPPLGSIIDALDKPLLANLTASGFPATPYVDMIKNVPDSGIAAFWDSPRFATGFAALHHCLGFCVETHMLKPFDQRVQATLVFMQVLLKQLLEPTNLEQISTACKKARLNHRKEDGTKYFPIAWKATNAADSIQFMGYEFGYKPSAVTGQPRLYYNQSKPWTKQIPYYHNFIPSDSVLLPKVYLFSMAWPEIAERLQLNGIEVRRYWEDTNLQFRVTYITGYETVKSPYEGHYLHYKTQTKDTVLTMKVRQGDYFVQVNGANRAFLAAVLEPRSDDSYLNWNFFDAVLQQKEGYSDYVYEDKAAEILATNAVLKKQFEQKKLDDASFAASPRAQLTWIYQHSDNFEKTVNLYPIFRLDN